MKTRFFYCIVLFLGIGLIACSDGEDGIDGVDGIDGEQGPAGPQGPQGIEGNANVTQYTFGNHDFSATASIILDIPDITEEDMNQSAWFVYLVRPSKNVYPIPGTGLNGASEYRLYWSPILIGEVNTVRFNIQKTSGTGEEYTNIQIIQVFANNTEDLSSKGLPDIDFRNYEAVKAHYRLTN
ncbi:collagen-like protein [Sinomicrobium pectinilyticum]|uniref:Collagen-like protein n=1 Tax=Sinomicrobium pectinilyticum TaxID=1084421 RepID=A0A3N0DQH5_SINP1|nr:collagen-like protein [Sinomicrobium pectinilyticum]RNL77887.1 collagen-like protein [Sinomicrobium pectinilyticum]